MAEDEEESHVPQPFWSGTIAFGLVSLPVDLYVAHRGRALTLHRVDEDGTQLRRRYFCPRDEEILSKDEIVRGHPVAEDRHVVVEDEELEGIAPKKSREIDLRRFVAVSDIDPMYFERAYLLTPGEGGVKPYRLLARTMEEEGLAGVATFVMRGKEYLVAILSEKGILRAEVLRFADELRSPADVGLPEPAEPDRDEVRRFTKEIRGLQEDELDREDLIDPDDRRLMDPIREKLRTGKDVVEPASRREPEEGEAEVIDLMEVLKKRLGRESRDEGGRDLQAWTREELYDRARALEIPGRSRMTKAELIDSIEKATGS